MNKWLFAAASGVALLASACAQAATINFTPGTSSLLEGDPFAVTETFDGAGCSAMSGATITGNFNLSNTSVGGIRAQPAGTSSCYAAVPANGGSGSATFDFGVMSGDRINYLGLYWGSIDTYNSVTFFDSANTELLTVTGSQALASMSAAGNQSSWASNRYVNIFFDMGEAVSYFTATSTQYAFEFDNVTVRTDGDIAVPEPAALSLLGFGLVAVAWRRRRRA